MDKEQRIGENMKKSFLLGLFFTLFLQFTTSYYYSYRFDKSFSTTCGVKNGYYGATDERFICVYNDLGALQYFAAFVLIRPKYNKTHGISFSY